MRKNNLRYGSARYAVKRLQPNLGQVDQARGAVDLAIEIKFLSTIWHPNISKCESVGDMMDAPSVLYYELSTHFMFPPPRVPSPPRFFFVAFGPYNILHIVKM